MNRNVIIIGCGGFSGVVADIITACNDNIIGYLDDNPDTDRLGPISDYYKYPDNEFIISIGNIAVREKLSQLPVKWYTAIDPSALISPSARVDEGTCVMPRGVVEAHTVIGKHCIINTAAVVSHNCSIGDCSHISIGANLAGGINVGCGTWIGIGSTVINNIDICSGCMIGGGTVVVKNITEQGTYVGVPAKKIK